MLSEWLFTQLHWQRPGFWLLTSFLGSIILLVMRRFISSERHSQLRMGRWFLIPYLGLLLGGLSPRLMGLTDIDWVAGLGVGIALIFAILVVLVLIRATFHLDDTFSQERSERATSAIAYQILAAGTQEFHWTFLRAATWELMVTAPVAYRQPEYWSIWIASLLALPGIFAQSRRTSQRLIACVILLTTAILFLYTRNFWLTWLLHTAAQLLLGQNTIQRESSLTGADYSLLTKQTQAQSLPQTKQPK